MKRHEGMRPERATHDVHLEDGADVGQGPLLRLWSRLLGHSGHRPEGSPHGTQLRAGQEGRSVREGHPAHHSHDGPIHGAHRERAVR